MESRRDWQYAMRASGDQSPRENGSESSMGGFRCAVLNALDGLERIFLIRRTDWVRHWFVPFGAGVASLGKFGSGNAA